LTSLGQGPAIGPGKLFVMRIALLASMGLLALGYCMLWGRRGKLARMSIIVATVLLTAVTWTLLRQPDFRSDLITKLEIRQLQHEPTIFAKHASLAEIDTEDEFFQYCHRRFLEQRDVLQAVWNVDDPRKLEALFYMNLVSGLWGAGNAQHADRIGCVSCNETTGFERLDAVTLKTYLNSEIGCCTDYAHLLKLLLDRAGINNRRVATAGHVFNEVEFDDGWDSLDANVNLWFEGDWASIQQSDASRNTTVVTMFPHHNMIAGDNPHFRAAAGQFRLHALLTSIHKSAPVVSYPDGR
jgi:hypothetical protein